jgi:phosphate transport system substrate-binding protein
MKEEKVVARADSKTSSEAVLELVAATPNAISYDGLGYVEGNSQVKSVSIDGVSASAKSILDKSYKLARPLILFTRGNADKTAIDFINFILSQEGQAIVKEARYVPVPHE